MRQTAWDMYQVIGNPKAIAGVSSVEDTQLGITSSNIALTRPAPNVSALKVA